MRFARVELSTREVLETTEVAIRMPFGRKNVIGAAYALTIGSDETTVCEASHKLHHAIGVEEQRTDRGG